MAPLVPSPGFHHPCLDYHSTSQVTITPRPHSSTSSRNMSLVAQVCPSLCDPMDCSPPGSSAHGTLQARILEWVAICFSRGSSPPGGQTQVFCIAGRFFTVEPHNSYHVTLPGLPGQPPSLLPIEPALSYG